MDSNALGRTRRSFLLALTLGIAATPALAYPDKPITMVVPNTPGGANDAVARLFAKELSTQLGQQVVVENRAGAGGNIGTASVARGARDGYTVLMTVNSAQAINPLLYKNAGFDPVKDFTPIGAVGSVPNVLLVNRTVKADTLKAFVDEARSEPGKLKYGSAGNGTLPHLLGAMLVDRAKADFVHVPYKGIAQALTDVLGGEISMAFATLPAALPHIRSGALRGIGVTAPQRSAALPDVPAFAELFPGYQGVLWIALYAPAGVPASVVERLDKALAAARQSPEVRARLGEIGVDPLNDGPEQLRKRLDDETALWSAVIKQAKIQID